MVRSRQGEIFLNYEMINNNEALVVRQ